MKIIDEKRYFWTEVKRKDLPILDKYGNHLSGFWSKEDKSKWEKRDFFILKALILFCLMRLSGIKASIKR